MSWRVRIQPNRLIGIGGVLAAWFAFALHDATVKLLVAEASAWQILFARSLIILPICLVLRRRARREAVITGSVRRVLVLNAVIYALAWVAYYSAARDLQLYPGGLDGISQKPYATINLRAELKDIGESGWTCGSRDLPQPDRGSRRDRIQPLHGKDSGIATVERGPSAS